MICPNKLRDYDSRKIISLFNEYHKKGMNKETISYQINPLEVSPELGIHLIEKYSPSKLETHKRELKKTNLGSKILEIINQPEKPKRKTKRAF